MKAGEERVNKASQVINEIMKIDDRAIPRDLLEKAKAIVVFPGSLKFSFIVGGQGGKGVVIRRLASGWSTHACHDWWVAAASARRSAAKAPITFS